MKRIFIILLILMMPLVCLAEEKSDLICSYILQSYVVVINDTPEILITDSLEDFLFVGAGNCENRYMYHIYIDFLDMDLSLTLEDLYKIHKERSSM